MDAHEKEAIDVALGCLLPLMWPWDGFRGLEGFEVWRVLCGLGMPVAIDVALGWF